MGKNTPDRQLFIIDHLKVEKDLPETLIGDAESVELEA